jgi:hypothetical protein
MSVLRIIAASLLAWLVVMIVFIAFMMHPGAAHAGEKYLAMQYNEQVRIVLSTTPCPNGQGWRAAAQRVDKQYLRACWTREPADKLIRLQWEGGDFSVLDADRFYPIEVEDAAK